ncbi:FxsA family protein [Nocardioides sp. TF02-7]|uniref:FxsA family protein n=1 Tax=Nocardioides sp. TF02-7 TaxID=2917724 RepID=UPI001F0534FB|nr:FxsA family protein [Nocardioides sp. TF02-7]UMG92526.1 FxsA family protein [Nocardioides sp. TF02-7]
MSTRRRVWPLLLVVVFVVAPLVELYVLIQVGQVIGAWWTILLLVVASVVGAVVVKREGRRAWQALQDALRAYRPPTRELADGALVLVGGALLLAPGFATDAIGLLLILPLTRPLFRRLLTAYVGSRVTTAVVGHPARARNDHRRGDDVVRGEVVDD